jgi:hypothetical protein
MPGMEGFYKDVAFVIILGTAIICTVGVSVICYRENMKLKTSDSENIEEIIDAKK